MLFLNERCEELTKENKEIKETMIAMNKKIEDLSVLVQSNIPTVPQRGSRGERVSNALPPHGRRG